MWKIIFCAFTENLDNSVGKTREDGLDEGRLETFSSPQRPHRLRGLPSLLCKKYPELFPPGVKLTTHLNQVRKSRKIEINVHSFVCFHGAMLTYIIT
jgi:hypothetical protein